MKLENKSGPSKKRVYSAPQITHEDTYARTSLATCVVAPGGCTPFPGQCVNSTGSTPC